MAVSGNRSLRTQRVIDCAVLCILVQHWACGARHHHVPDLYQAKQEIIAYYESGTYEKDIRDVTDRAREYLSSQLSTKRERMAVVFDIDETCISNWKNERNLDFGFFPDQTKEWQRQAAAPAIQPILDLYLFARREGFAVFFISGRPESMRDSAAKNLRRVGFTEWTALYLRPDNVHCMSA
jgi:predicted secreted acid phosphatase